MSNALVDIRQSAKRFLRTPGFTLALLLSIALGTGVNVSVYGFARGLTRTDRLGTLFDVAAGAVFFIACTNVVLFLLGRAFTRSYEISLRTALGARRIQLARELLWDSIVVSVAGGAMGAMLADWTVHIVPALLYDQDATQLVFTPGWFTIIAASAVCVAVTILCGLLPVFAIANDHPETVLRRESARPSRPVRRVRTGLVVVQMASCCVLAASSAFLLDGFRAAVRTSAGRHLGDPMLATVQAQPITGIHYFREVQQAVRPVAGISALAWAGRLPGSQPTWKSFRIEPPNLPVRDVRMDIAWFTSDSLKLFALPPKAGRLFGFEDRTCRVAIVNETAAEELFGGNTVGRVVRDPAGQPVEIIGVVAEKKSSGPTIYYNHADETETAPERTRLAAFRAPVQKELVTARLDMNVVSSNYFKAMDLKLVAGQQLPPNRMPGMCRAGVINRQAADLYFQDKPLGTAVIDDQGIRTEIIGVMRSQPLGVLQRHAEPAIYFPMWQDCLPRMTLIVGTRHASPATVEDLRGRIESVPGRGRAPLVIQTLTTHLAHTALAPLRIAMVIVGVSAGTALLLSAIGLFGVLSDTARQRRRDVAIRLALGAQQWRIVYQVLSEGGRLAGTGVLTGVPAALLLWRLFGHILPVSGPPAFWAWLVGPVVLGVMVILASVLPARRALALNPIMILREDK